MLAVVFIIVVGSVGTQRGDPAGLSTTLHPLLSFENLTLKYRHT